MEDQPGRRGTGKPDPAGHFQPAQRDVCEGDNDVEFQNVAQVIDIARGTNVIDRIGLITAKIEAGQ
jgi:biopolymer transport protein ExbD